MTLASDWICSSHLGHSCIREVGSEC